MKKITVFGGGAWGRALAVALAQKNAVKIVSRQNLGGLPAHSAAKLKTQKIRSVKLP